MASLFTPTPLIFNNIVGLLGRKVFRVRQTFMPASRREKCHWGCAQKGNLPLGMRPEGDSGGRIQKGKSSRRVDLSKGEHQSACCKYGKLPLGMHPEGTKFERVAVAGGKWQRGCTQQEILQSGILSEVQQLPVGGATRRKIANSNPGKLRNRRKTKTNEPNETGSFAVMGGVSPSGDCTASLQ